MWHSFLQKSLTEFYKGESYLTDSEKHSKPHTDVISLHPHVASNMYGGCLLLFKESVNMLSVFSKWLPQHTHSLFWVRGIEEHVVLKAMCLA